MANMNINITGLDTIAQAINNLAQALGKGGVTASFSESTPAGPQSTQMAGNYQNPGPVTSGPQQSGLPGTGTAAAGQPGMMQYQQPFTGQAGQGALPTTATTQSYTQDQIAIALTGLIDQGKRDYVTQILGQFGAMSLMQVPVERYPELVTQLRGAGANI